jgi:hypothetical protein
MLHSLPCTLKCAGPSLSTNSVILGTSLYCCGEDHIENTDYCTDVLPPNFLANSHNRVVTALLPSTGHGADHIENTSSVVRIFVLPSN